MANVLAIGLVQFNEAIAFAGHVIMFGGILLGIRDEKSSADILDVERREAPRNRIVVEHFFRDVHRLEGIVVDFHSARAEIRDVQENLSVYESRGSAFVNRAVRRTSFGIVHF